jgi:hypothetical protein
MKNITNEHAEIWEDLRIDYSDLKEEIEDWIMSSDIEENTTRFEVGQTIIFRAGMHQGSSLLYKSNFERQYSRTLGLLLESNT